jgi:hypothetical protein
MLRSAARIFDLLLIWNIQIARNRQNPANMKDYSRNDIVLKNLKQQGTVNPEYEKTITVKIY